VTTRRKAELMLPFEIRALRECRGGFTSSAIWWRITTLFGELGSWWWGGRHQGLDVGVPEGTPLVCPFREGGEIFRAGTDGSSGGLGNFVAIKGGFGGIVLYAHLKYRTPWWKALYTWLPGTRKVAFGQFVGASGNTGFSTGPHVHIQCTLGSEFGDLWGRAVDPIPYLTWISSPQRLKFGG